MGNNGEGEDCTGVYTNGGRNGLNSTANRS